MTPQELKQQAHGELSEIILGIDKDECEDDLGWWETSDGVEFGKRKKEELKDFIDSLIDRTVQMTEERIAQNVKSELRLWSGFGEYYGNATRFANSILSLITSKSDTNKSEESGSYKKGLLDAIKLVCICKGTIVDLNCPHNKIAMRLMDVEFGTEDTEENELILASKKQAFKRRGK